MKVHGNLSITEGNVVVNLTMPSGGEFPVGTVGELFYLDASYNGYVIGPYYYTGTEWRELNGTSEGGGTGTNDHQDLIHRTSPNAHPAIAVSASTSSFNTILGSADDTVQKALDSLDDHTHPGSYEPADSNIQAHISDKDNPHTVTASQTGAYTISQVDTLLSGKEPFNINIQAHISSMSNPHGTTAEQLSVYTINQTNAALAAKEPANSNIQTHIARTDNPHNTTAAQVGTYTTTQINASLALKEPANSNIQTHIARTDNPHNTTAAQVGTYTTTQIDDIVAASTLGYTPVNRAGDYADNTELRNSRVRQSSDQTLGTGTCTLDYNTGDLFKVTVTGNISIAFSNLPANMVTSITIECVNFGSYTVTWPVGIKWPSGVAPAFTSIGTDFVTILKDKNNVYRGFLLCRDSR